MSKARKLLSTGDAAPTLAPTTSYSSDQAQADDTSKLMNTVKPDIKLKK